jgi:hypothetical protein
MKRRSVGSGLCPRLGLVVAHMRVAHHAAPPHVEPGGGLAAEGAVLRVGDAGGPPSVSFSSGHGWVPRVALALVAAKSGAIRLAVAPRHPPVLPHVTEKPRVVLMTVRRRLRFV